MVQLIILLNFIGMVFELFFFIIAVFLLILLFRKYRIKRYNRTRLLFIIFLNYLVAFLFSWLSKFFVVFQINMAQDGSIIAWFYNIILDFRLSALFVTFAIFLSYILKLNIFEEGDNIIEKFNDIWDNIVIIYVMFTSVFVLIIYESGNTFLDVLASLIVLIYMVMVYVPFLQRALQAYHGIQDYKQAFLSLAMMLISFMLIFLNFVIDRLFIFLGSPGFPIFYFLVWIFAIVGIFGAYYGYKSPKSSEE